MLCLLNARNMWRHPVHRLRHPNQMHRIYHHPLHKASLFRPFHSSLHQNQTPPSSPSGSPPEGASSGTSRFVAGKTVHKQQSARRGGAGAGAPNVRGRRSRPEMFKFTWIHGLFVGAFLFWVLVMQPLFESAKDDEGRTTSGSTMNTFISPTEVMEQRELFPPMRKLRLGGIVKEGSIAHNRNTFLSTFILTDLKHEIEVEHKGSLPDLFAENTGAICEGFMIGPSKFKSIQVFAKHDARYMPQDLAVIVTRNRRMLDEERMEEQRKKYREAMQAQQQQQQQQQTA